MFDVVSQDFRTENNGKTVLIHKDFQIPREKYPTICVKEIVYDRISIHIESILKEKSIKSRKNFIQTH